MIDSMKRKKANWFVLVAAAALPWLPAYSQEKPVPGAPALPPPEAAQGNLSPSVAELVKLAQSGVGDDGVIAFIKNSQAFYNLSANDVLALKNAGLSSPVLTAMLNHDSALRNQPRTPSYEQKLYAPVNSPSTTPNVPANPPSAIPDAPSVPTPATVPSAPLVS